MSTEIFNAIAPRYDRTNYVLSFGMDTGWRRKMAHFLPDREGLHILDLATGTGDMAMILGRDHRVVEVLGLDVSEGMLEIGRKKVAGAGLSCRVSLRQGDAMALDLPDGRFDAVTAAFGVRNFPDLMKGLGEAFRVIKPGGCLIVLEFSSPSTGPLRYGHTFYLRVLVPFIGALLTGNRKAYRYLSATIAAFPYGTRFMRIIRQTGFEDVQCYPLAWGAATIYVGQKGISS